MFSISIAAVSLLIGSGCTMSIGTPLLCFTGSHLALPHAPDRLAAGPYVQKLIRSLPRLGHSLLAHSLILSLLVALYWFTLCQPLK